MTARVEEPVATTPALDETEVPARGAADRVDAAVLAWCRWYTADLPAAEAADRRAELASDLHEERGVGGAGATRSILGRAARGIPADLAWRRARLRRAALGAPRGTFPVGMPALTNLAIVLLLAWGVLVVWRIAASMLAGAWAGAWDLVAAGVVGLAMALIGAWLVVIRRRRTLGAFWLATAAYVLIRFGTYAVVATSLSLTEFHVSSTAQFLLLVRAATVAGVLFFVAMAVWWAAAPRVAEETEGNDA